MSNQVLITGGAGFIGSHLVRALLLDGCEVRVLDNFSTGRRQNLSDVASSIDLIEGDVRSSGTCAAACVGIETIYHMAGLGSVPRSIDDPVTSNDVNVGGTLNLLLAARDARANRVVFSSSSSVYGDTPVLPKHETMRPSPRSPYAVSKLAAEEYCRAFNHTYGLETVVLRYFNVFGPRQRPDSQYAAVIPRFLAALNEGRQPVLYGDGLQSRDFTYVDNVIYANILAGQTNGIAGEVFNIACGEQITVKQVLADISTLLESEIKPYYEASRQGDVLHSLADISAARARLNFSPRTYFSEGLAETVRSFMSPFTQPFEYSASGMLP